MVSLKSPGDKVKGKPGASDDKPAAKAGRWHDGYGLPVLFSLVLHSLALGIALMAWSPPTELHVNPVPQHMAAQLVELEPEKPKPVPKPPTRKPEPKPVSKPAEPEKKTPVKKDNKPKVDEKALQLKREKEAKERAEKIAREKREREEKERRRKEEEKRKQDEARKKREQQELADRLRREQAAKDAQEKAEAEARAVASKVQYFTGLFIQDLSYNWSRPPSARNNMRARFRITLSRFGDIQTLSLLSGSGDAAFDRSAEQAIRKAAPFSWARQMDSQTYNRFKQFTFEFNPEDLVK
ncbi:TonB family protein [Endozoicomonadaceae bacterium StTr2]